MEPYDRLEVNYHLEKASEFILKILSICDESNRP